MNEGLFTAYQSLPAWKRLMERIGEGGCTALYLSLIHICPASPRRETWES